MKTLKLTRRPDGVAVLSLDTPGSPVNVLSRDSTADLAAALDELAKDSSVRACVLISAKSDTFIAGADLDEIAKATDAKAIEAWSKSGHELLGRIETSRVPFVAAIHGATLGGGLEVALACHSRVATSDSKTVFALPEVQLGVLPGAGGTQRLPRLIGLRQALPMLLAGNRVRAPKALELGLVDALVGRDELLEAAAKRALVLAPRWKSRAPLIDRLLALPPLRTALLSQARKQVLRKTRGLYPAPLRILDAVAGGYASEAKHFGELVVSPEAKNLVWIFHATQELKKQAAPKPVKKLAVLGAGLMGEGIAQVSLPLSEVVLKDLAEKSLARARENIARSFGKRPDLNKHLDRLKTTTETAAIAGAELVIEAVFEDLALKRKVLAEVEAVVAPSAVFASNTSALPLAEVAAQAKHPERVLGMHYFSPVPKMPLLEIIVTPRTEARATDLARSYGAAQGKTVIVVKDGPGFYTTRILAPLLNESMLLVEEGASLESIDSALKDFGYPVGPITLLDEVGLDVGAHVATDLGRAFGSRWGRSSEALSRLVAAGHTGKKSGRGLYAYPDKTIDPKVYEFFGSPARRELDPREIADRVAGMMINEAVHCLQEGVIASPRDGDIGAIFGLGFPPFRGGPFHYADSRGKALVDRLSELAAKHGPRFEPAALLKKGRFYA